MKRERKPNQVKEKSSSPHGDREIYRRLVNPAGMVSFGITIKETDLMVLAEKDLSGEAREIVLRERHRLEEHIRKYPEFRTSLEPLEEQEGSPRIVLLMTRAAAAAGVGPMAAVAGAIAQMTGEGLREYSREIFVENGGDCYCASSRDRVISIFTDEKTFGAGIGIRVKADDMPLGICTSSGRIGESVSYGDASTATVTAQSAALADAAATAVGNRVRGPDGIERGLALAQEIEGVLGVVVVRDRKVGAWGAVELADPGAGE